jgi:hypothetical protein
MGIHDKKLFLQHLQQQQLQQIRIRIMQIIPNAEPQDVAIMYRFWLYFVSWSLIICCTSSAFMLVTRKSSTADIVFTKDIFKGNSSNFAFFKSSKQQSKLIGVFYDCHVIERAWWLAINLTTMMMTIYIFLGFAESCVSSGVLWLLNLDEKGSTVTVDGRHSKPQHRK